MRVQSEDAGTEDSTRLRQKGKSGSSTMLALALVLRAGAITMIKG